MERPGVLGALTVCLPCSPHRGDGWDSGGRPPALGARVPAAAAQQSAGLHAAAPAPRRALDLHWVRPWPQALGRETSHSLSLSVHVRDVGTIQPTVQKASHRPSWWLCLLSPTPRHRASLGGRYCVGATPRPH